MTDDTFARAYATLDLKTLYELRAAFEADLKDLEDGGAIEVKEECDCADWGMMGHLSTCASQRPLREYRGTPAIAFGKRQLQLVDEAIDKLLRASETRRP